MGGQESAMVAINPYLGMVSSLDADAFDALCSAVAERKCRDLIGAGTLDEAAALLASANVVSRKT